MPGNGFGQQLTGNEEIGKFKTSVSYAFYRRIIVGPTHPSQFHLTITCLLCYYNLLYNSGVKFHI